MHRAYASCNVSAFPAPQNQHITGNGNTTNPSCKHHLRGTVPPLIMARCCYTAVFIVFCATAVEGFAPLTATPGEGLFFPVNLTNNDDSVVGLSGSGSDVVASCVSSAPGVVFVGTLCWGGVDLATHNETMYGTGNDPACLASGMQQNAVRINSTMYATGLNNAKVGITNFATGTPRVTFLPVPVDCMVENTVSLPGTPYGYIAVKVYSSTLSAALRKRNVYPFHVETGVVAKAVFVGAGQTALAVSGKYLLCSVAGDGGTSTLYVFDTSDPAAPSLLQQQTIGVQMARMVAAENILVGFDVSGEYVVVLQADSWEGEVSLVKSFKFFDTTASLMELRIELDASMVFVTRWYEDLMYVIDVSDAANVVVSMTVYTGKNANIMSFCNGTLYMTTSTSLLVMDIPQSTDAPSTVAPPTPAPPTTAPATLTPTSVPTAMPTAAPTAAPPTSVPTATPTTAVPTAGPTPAPPTSLPTAVPTATPAAAPPTSVPTAMPTAGPTPAPPISVPTAAPTTTPAYVPHTVPPHTAPPLTKAPAPEVRDTPAPGGSSGGSSYAGVYVLCTLALVMLVASLVMSGCTWFLRRQEMCAGEGEGGKEAPSSEMRSAYEDSTVRQTGSSDPSLDTLLPFKLVS